MFIWLGYIVCLERSYETHTERQTVTHYYSDSSMQPAGCSFSHVHSLP